MNHTHRNHEILKTIEDIWIHNPELSLSQILAWAANDNKDVFFYMKDDFLLSSLKEIQLESHRENKRR